MKKYLKSCIRFIYHIMVKVLPVRRKIIVFNSNVGRNYTGNPRALYEAMRADDRYKEYKKIWFFNREYIKGETYKKYSKYIQSDSNSRIVTYGLLRYHYHMAVAGVWIFDGRQESYLVKRKKVTYLQCWHGTPLKKLALDMENLNMSEEKDITDYKNRFLKESAAWDMLISQNPFSTETFRRCFGFKGDMFEEGYPRNDMLRKSKHEISALKETYSIPRDKKVILYAPTWRDDRSNGDGSYKFVSELDFKAVYEKLNEEYIFIIKQHYLVRQKLECDKSFVKVFGADTDITELYLISDMLITDYSSVMFDYIILDKPMIFYMFDLESYRDTLRGFYFDILAEAPGPIVKNTEELIDAITEVAAKGTDKLSMLSFKSKYAPHDDGQAAKRILDRLYKTIR